MRLGILDSDLGGLALARRIRQCLPQWDVVVMADTARTPLGKRSPEAIGEVAERGADFLVRAGGAGMIVVSCHILASIAGDRLARSLTIPVLSISEAAASEAAAVSLKNRFGLMAAPATVESRYFEAALARLRPEARVFSVATPLLRQLVEEGWLKKPVTGMIVKTYLRPLKLRQIDTLILGCSHLTVLEKTLSRKAGARTSLVTGVDRLMDRLREAAEKGGGEAAKTSLTREGSLRICVTEKTPHLEKAASLFFSGPVLPETVQW
jgi:glutamate racemase